MCVTEQFLRACAGGDIGALSRILAHDASLVADGGGRAAAPRQPLHGSDAVATFLARIAGRSATERHAEVVEVNGRPAIIVHSKTTPVAVVTLDVHDGVVQNVYIVANPDKLAGLARRSRG